MKVVTLFGTRPEIIRLSRIITRLDKQCDQVLVHTGQNYEDSLSGNFFQELGVRAPDFNLGIKAATFSDQVAQILKRVGEVFAKVKPERLLILGDTNSCLSALIAARMGIRVYHMEAGNRCYDNRVPEEINRRVIDHTSDVLMPYTQRSKENLLREGIERQRIFVIGNPIREVLDSYSRSMEENDVLRRFELPAGEYFLCTVHRAENVDSPERLTKLLRGLALVADSFNRPMLVSVHPRTAARIAESRLTPESPRLRFVNALGFFDFIQLERNAMCVLSDSGTVQEECCIARIPVVTIRDVTERAETIECGSNILSGAEPESIQAAVRVALDCDGGWVPPCEYMETNVSSTVSRIVLGYDWSPIPVPSHLAEKVRA